MNDKEFFIAVKNMREMQRLYFRTRDKIALLESKKLEKIIDSEISRVEFLDKNPELL